VQLLAGREDAKCLAGGQTLIAMMNAGLLDLGAIVSLRRVVGLDGIEFAADGSLWIGAMTRHAAVAKDLRIGGGHAVVRRAAEVIAHPAIRNMGTLGGSICHADPNSDYPAAIVAAEAEVEIAGPDGGRTVAAADFFVDYLTTQLEPGELVTRVRLPAAPAGSVGVYEKFARTDGDYATVSVALMLQMSAGKCQHIRLALGACGMTAVRVRAAEELLEGSDLAEDVLRDAAALLVEACDPIDDVRGSAEYRRMLVPTLVRRALDRAYMELEARS
jgi:carbon-monoxide dehydrogenase medium subunit